MPYPTPEDFRSTETTQEKAAAIANKIRTLFSSEKKVEVREPTRREVAEKIKT